MTSSSLLVRYCIDDDAFVVDDVDSDEEKDDDYGDGVVVIPVWFVILV